MKFHETALVAENDGTLHVIPSYSPENAPNGWSNGLSIDATTEIAAIRDAVIVATRFAHALGDEEPIDRWRLLRERLPQYRVTDEGTLAEWVTARTPSRHRLGPNRNVAATP